MKLVTRKLLNKYLKKDFILKKMNQESSIEEEKLTSQKWLRESEAKRLIFAMIYGDLWSSLKDKKILDVGGGMTIFTELISKKNNYFLCDILAHGNLEQYKKIEKKINYKFLFKHDWSDILDDSFDLIIANDIFPNVDQRLDLFLKFFLPKCKKMRLSLTWYNNQRAYKVKKVGGKEVFTLLAYDGKQVKDIITHYSKCIVNYNPKIFATSQPSLFPNGRQVACIELKGFLKQ